MTGTATTKQMDFILDLLTDDAGIAVGGWENQIAAGIGADHVSFKSSHGSFGKWFRIANKGSGGARLSKAQASKLIDHLLDVRN